MFVHRTTFLPLPGKFGEVRKLVEETTRERQQAGVSASATAMIYGPEDHAGAVHMLMRYPDLAALEKHRREMQRDAALPGQSRFGMAIGGLLRTNLSAALAEVILPPPSSSLPGRWVLRAVATPTTERFNQAGRAAVRFAEVQQNLGFTTSVVRTRLSPTQFVTNRAHASLEELEESWKTLADPEAAAAVSELLANLSGPLTVELHEVMVPLAG